MAIIKGRLGAVYMAQYGAGATAFTKEAMTANVAKTVFTIDAATKRFWDPATAITVYYNDILTTAYATAQYPAGVVTWAVTPGNDAVTVSGKYLAVATVGECKSWSMDVQWDFIDTTTFGDVNRESTPIMRASTATIGRFYVDDQIFTEMISTNYKVGFDLFLEYDAGTPANCKRYSGYGTIASVSPSAAVDGIVEEGFAINITDGPYYVAGLA